MRRQLRFFHTTFEWWVWTWALTVWMVSFCIVVWVENEGGVYRVGHVVGFAAVSVGLILGSYALMRLGHYPMRPTVARHVCTTWSRRSPTRQFAPITSQVLGNWNRLAGHRSHGLSRMDLQHVAIGHTLAAGEPNSDKHLSAWTRHRAVEKDAQARRTMSPDAADTWLGG